MPKLKTKRAAAKRFRQTASGKIKAAKAYSRHIFASKTQKQKRRLRGTFILDSTDQKHIKKVLPYGLPK